MQTVERAFAQRDPDVMHELSIVICFFTSYYVHISPVCSFSVFAVISLIEWNPVFLQEIQDRIRIIELYAKDRQFADFVRQHQAWVHLSAAFWPEWDNVLNKPGFEGRKRGSGFEIQETNKTKKAKRLFVCQELQETESPGHAKPGWRQIYLS